IAHRCAEPERKSQDRGLKAFAGCEVALLDQGPITTVPVWGFNGHRMATHGRLVFLVDDDESVRKALRRVLVASGFQVKAFADGVDFLDAVTAQRPDCLVIDLHMPGLTGLDVLRQLTHLEPPGPATAITAA